MQTSTNASIRQDLREFVNENQLGAGEFIGEKAMPVFGVAVKAGKFLKMAFEQVLTSVDAKRGPGGNYNRIEHETEGDTFNCEEFGLEEPIDDGEAETLGLYFDAETAAAQQCEYNVRLEEEQRKADILFNTAVITNTAAVAISWDTAATATPVKDVDVAKRAIRTQMNGRLGGTRIVALCHGSVITLLKATSDIKDRAGRAMRGLENWGVDETGNNVELATTLGLSGVYDSELLRGGTAIWTNSKFGLYVVAEGQNLRAPQCARSILWTEDSPDPLTMETYRQEEIRSEVVRVRQHLDEKLISARGGYILTGIQ